MHKEAAADMQNGDATREAMLNGEVAEGQEELDFDALLATRVGEFGRKQCLLSMLLVSSAISSCVHALASVFLAGQCGTFCFLGQRKHSLVSTPRKIRNIAKFYKGAKTTIFFQMTSQSFPHFFSEPQKKLCLRKKRDSFVAKIQSQLGSSKRRYPHTSFGKKSLGMETQGEEGFEQQPSCDTFCVTRFFAFLQTKFSLL